MIFDIFINHVFSCKYRYYFRIHTPCLYQIRKSTVHGLVRLWKYEWLFRFWLLIHAFPVCNSLFSTKQHCNCIRKALVIKHPHKVNGTASLFCRVIIPSISPHCNTVITGQALFSSRTKQLFPLPGKKIFQIHRIGPLFLFFGKINKFSHAILLRQ